ncbi:MAG: RNA-binding protein [Spirochaetales bacterium]|nr:RNA-binding protein [Spirochaetales bacterium]
MYMNIYAGNLSYALTEDELREAFSEYGEVISAKIIMDRDTGRSKGFGFVEMGNAEAGEKAIEALDGSLLKGRNLKVNQARPR